MKKSTLLGIILFPIITIILISFLILTINKADINYIKKSYMDFITDNYIEEQKNIAQENVKLLKETIKYENSQVENTLKSEIQEKLEIAKKLVASIYEKNQSKLYDDEIKQVVLEQLSDLKYSDDGYYYVIDFDSEIVLSHPKADFVGKDIKVITNDDERLTQAKKDFLVNNENYIAYEKLFFYKPDEDKQYPKLNGRVWFKPLNIIIGTGEYLDSIESKIKQEIIKKIEAIDSENIFIYEHKNKSFNLINKNIVIT